jgi:hypothetical protein
MIFESIAMTFDLCIARKFDLFIDKKFDLGV